MPQLPTHHLVVMIIILTVMMTADDVILSESETPKKAILTVSETELWVFLSDAFPKKHKVLMLPWQESPWTECKLKPSIFENKKILIYWAIELCISLFTGFPNTDSKAIKSFFESGHRLQTWATCVDIECFHLFWPSFKTIFPHDFIYACHLCL